MAICHTTPAENGPHAENCGDLGLGIDWNGQWFYHGSPIDRKEMVCLFASMLHRAPDGQYWLITDDEKGTIQVADVPFLAVELYRCQCGRDQVISFRTNLDELVTLDADHPLRMGTSPETGDPLPYILVRPGLEARLTRSVYYELMGLGYPETIDGKELYGLWSNGLFFPLGQTDTP